MPSDAELMEASLEAVAETGIEIRHALFERFFAAYPEREPLFLAPEATSVRMTDETLQMLFGLATEESWVWPMASELVEIHRAYGFLPEDEFTAFVAMTIETLGEAAGEAWTPDAEAAWRRQAEKLNALIHKARVEWAEAMPHPSDRPPEGGDRTER